MKHELQKRLRAARKNPLVGEIEIGCPKRQSPRRKMLHGIYDVASARLSFLYSHVNSHIC